MNKLNLKDVLLLNREIKAVNNNEIEVKKIINKYLKNNEFFNDILQDIENGDWTEPFYLNEAPSFKKISNVIPTVFEYTIENDSDEIIISFEDIYSIGGGDNGETFSLIENQLTNALYEQDIDISGTTENSIYCAIEFKKDINKILKKMNFSQKNKKPKIKP